MTIDVTAVGLSAEQILAWTQGMVDSTLQEAVDRLPGELGRIAGYHFGWLDQDGRSGHYGSGKAIRPALVLLSAQAVGGLPETAISAAVAVELVHNFSLLHDDVMDRDLVRRGRPAVWRVFGIPAAILTGDAMLALAPECLTWGYPALADIAQEWLSRCVVELCHGQAMDVSFEQRNDIDLAGCLTMAAAKTGALLGTACALGALAGGAALPRVEHLRSYGNHLGLAFQLVDDLLGIWGDPSVTGKPLRTDLANRKKSLPVTAVLTSDTPEASELASLYQLTRPLEDAELTHAADLIERAGGRAWAQQRAEQELRQAEQCLQDACCSPESVTALRTVANLITNRDC